MTIYSENPTARKEYTCSWCEGKIYKGESYSRFTVFGKNREVFKTHHSCDLLVERNGFYQYVDNNNLEYNSTSFRDWVKMEFGEIPLGYLEHHIFVDDLNNVPFEEMLKVLRLYYKITTILPLTKKEVFYVN